ncbi:AraC family ligand binding domain-containing protein [Stieleria marina]|uniref:AraC family ligand binding domain-containing protein n=1 Tax=Stieleria marina TaxID=1930275 RepID=UPI003AF3EB5F
MSRPDRHDEIEISFLDQGTLTYLIGGNRVTVEPRTVTLFWAAVPHQIIQFSDVTQYHVITIPFGWFLQWGLPENLQTQLITGKVVCAETDNSFSLRDQMLLQQWQKDSSRDAHDMT